MTYLHFAVEGGDMNTVKYLVDKGADINIKDDHGVSVWDYISEMIIVLLFENNNLLV